MVGWKPKDLKTMKRVNPFVDMDTEVVGGTEVRAEGSEIKEESSSKDKRKLRSTNAKKQKLDKQGKEDLEVLWRIVKARFKKTEPVNYMNIFLHLNLKTMFEHHVEDNIWKNQQGLVKVLNWKLFDSCRVHCVTVQSIPYYLLVEKIFLDWSRNILRKAMYLDEVFGNILLVIFNEKKLGSS
ncbi:hypothetical protein Tco_0098352 [Tanacetum coccineum]